MSGKIWQVPHQMGTRSWIKWTANLKLQIGNGNYTEPNIHKIFNELKQKTCAPAGQVFVVLTDGWRTGAGVLRLSRPLIGQSWADPRFWLAETDNRADRVNETDSGTCAWLLVRFADWLNALALLYLLCGWKNNKWFLLYRWNISCPLDMKFIDLKHWGVRMKSSSLFCVCFCSFLSSCYLCKAMMNDEPYLESLFKLNKTTPVSVHSDAF